MSKLPMKVTDTDKVHYCYLFHNKKYQILTVENDKIEEPHFHIIDLKTDGKKFHCRILLRKSNYMKGETTKLNKREINSLIKHLQSTPKNLKCNCWVYLVWLWNSYNNKKAYYKRMPDYTKLK